MEFVHVDPGELNNVDFSLPAEPAFNKNVLSGNKNKNAKVLIGCSK